MILKLKTIVKAKPGKRFYLLHRYSRKKLSNPFVLLMFLIISVVALILGLIMIFTPGPGLFFIGLALLPFIAISKKLARLLDKLEIYSREKIKKKKF
ncbi:hypothetical protein AB4F11_01350 [Francisella philomiragia]